MTVVGAGPVGLLLAAELARAGVSVQVLERLTGPDETIKAGSISPTTAESLQRRGLLAEAQRVQSELLARLQPGLAGSGSISPEDQRRLMRRAGHFAGIMIDGGLVDDDDPDVQAHLSEPLPTLVPQRQVEALLAAHADSLGVPVRRGVCVTGLHQDADGVLLETDAGPVRSAWVVGCDGGRSVVRKQAGFDFPGTDGEITGLQAVADVVDPEQLSTGWNWTPHGVYAYGPMPGRVLTVEFDGAPADRSAPVTVAEVQDSLRRVSGTDVRLTGLHGTATRWTDNARQASSYRNGRVLLAGDAAHVHSPFSGQGLNLGIGDAMNLGWKLAATVTGWAPDGLLDSYTAERHPLGEWVLDWTRAQVALMRGDAKTAALRTVLADLMATPDGMTHIVKQITGITQRLDLPGEHPLVGRNVPALPLAEGTLLAASFTDGRFVLLDRTPDASVAELAAGWADRVVVVRDRSDQAPSALLVRPDGVVAWAADDGSPDLSAARQALLRWAGRPVTG